MLPTLKKTLTKTEQTMQAISKITTSLFNVSSDSSVTSKSNDESFTKIIKITSKIEANTATENLLKAMSPHMRRRVKQHLQ
mmetsp:Transcript_34558/g.79900  ORF Transcript_34558/g.79900 Transcript_34558/m.79900 type:complete len:81 (-) Transcript_34558:119-361(-)